MRIPRVMPFRPPLRGEWRRRIPGGGIEDLVRRQVHQGGAKRLDTAAQIFRRVASVSTDSGEKYSFSISASFANAVALLVREAAASAMPWPRRARWESSPIRGAPDAVSVAASAEGRGRFETDPPVTEEAANDDAVEGVGEGSRTSRAPLAPPLPLSRSGVCDAEMALGGVKRLKASIMTRPRVSTLEISWIMRWKSSSERPQQGTFAACLQNASTQKRRTLL